MIQNAEKDICFLSILFPEDNEEYIQNTIKARSQNISFIQQSLIDGISEANGGSIWVINTPLVSLFPGGYKTPFVKTSALTVGNHEGVNHSFINFAGFYSSSLFWGAKQHLKKWAQANSKKEKIVIAYSLTNYTLTAMQYLKHLNPSIKTAIIVPDIPKYTYGNPTHIIKKLKIAVGKLSINRKIQLKAKYVDDWILFSEKMIEEIPNINRYVVFEGLSTNSFSEITPERFGAKSDNICLLYAGGLSEAYGINLLLDAFNMLNEPRYKLFIAGKGSTEIEDHIRDVCRRNSRIEFLGEIPRETLLRLEKGCDVLINPRTNSGLFTRYSFPSKNMEYLSSGTPFIGFKLEGIPDEYDTYINYPDAETAEALAKTIIDVAQNKRAESIKRAADAQRMVREQKNKYAQGRKILESVYSV